MVGFIVVLSIIMMVVIGGAAITYITKQANAPVQTAKAKVVSKRHFRNAANGVTSYRMTFEAEGQLLELIVRYETYHSLNEGDEGTLTYKGCWFTNFEK